MNKMIKKIALAIAVCAAVCTTAMAAPKGPGHGQKPNGQGPKVEMRVKAETKKAKPNEPRREVAQDRRHAPAPKPDYAAHDHRRHDNHRPEHGRRHHHNNTLHTEDWCSMGASLIGGVIGGLLGAVR